MSDLIERLQKESKGIADWPAYSTFNAEEWALELLCAEAAAELARLTAEVERYRSAIRWALGYDEGEPDFHERRDGDKPYYWRTELARRAGAGVRDEAIKEAGNG